MEEILRVHRERSSIAQVELCIHSIGYNPKVLENSQGVQHRSKPQFRTAQGPYKEKAQQYISETKVIRKGKEDILSLPVRPVMLLKKYTKIKLESLQLHARLQTIQI